MNLPKTYKWHNRTVRQLVRCEDLTAMLLRIQAFWDVTLSGEQIVTFWSGVVPSPSKNTAYFFDSLTLKRKTGWSPEMLGITHPAVQCHIANYFDHLQNYSPTSVLHYITMRENFDKRQKTHLFVYKTNHFVWMLSSTFTYSIKYNVTYSPSLDSFHILQSKGWDMDVDKLGS